jgi:C-terminal processing protease CtpA/Prc/predicted small lipoprotein YifL
VKKYVSFALLAMVLSTLIACRAVGPSSFHPTQKLSAAQQRADLTLLQNILEANHPSLYWYTPKDSVDAYFANTHATLKDSLTEREFKNKVAWVISKIRCGHTVVRHSKKYAHYFEKHRQPVFPLSIKIWDDSAVVLSNLNRNDSLLKRGTIITGINRYPIKTLIDSMCQLVGTDGYSTNFKYQLISFNFPAYYRNSFGLDSQYTIHYIDTTGKRKTTIVKNYRPPHDSIMPRHVLPENPITKRELRKLNTLSKRNMVIDTALHTAILSVNTFSEGHLQGFYKRSFREIRKNGLQNVVIDLRQNSGGSVLLSTKLTQYLVDKKFRIADTVAANTRSFPYKRYIKPWIIYWLSMHVTGRRLGDDRIHFRYFEKHYFKPKNKNHFDGQVYIITGGYTFSAATLVTGALKGQQNVTIVGEETGGGAYGNSAMHLPMVVLPNSGLRITLPLYRIVLNSKLPKNGRGILPDVEVRPSSNYIRQGIDPKMEKVRELILKKSSS